MHKHMYRMYITYICSCIASPGILMLLMYARIHLYICIAYILLIYAHVYISIAYILLIYAHTQAKRDPVTAPEFRYKGVTLGDLISLKFDQRDSDEVAWAVACDALVPYIYIYIYIY